MEEIKDAISIVSLEEIQFGRENPSKIVSSNDSIYIQHGLYPLNNNNSNNNNNNNDNKKNRPLTGKSTHIFFGLKTTEK